MARKQAEQMPAPSGPANHYIAHPQVPTTALQGNSLSKRTKVLKKVYKNLSKQGMWAKDGLQKP